VDEHRRFIVTVDVPIYISVSAPDAETASGLAETYWSEDKVADKLELGLEDTGWFAGDPYEDWDVSLDDAQT